jgi:1-acyl-sn-glycerol-3-phosphate acyltransferase
MQFAESVYKTHNFHLLCSMRFLFKFIFNSLGWKIIGDAPRQLKKYIIIVAPHTSNWDFPLGVAVRSIMRFPSNYLGKQELFRPPFGWIFRKLGGYPVDRSKSSHLVDQVVEIFQKEPQFVLAIAPEGTRKNVTKWKTGFYHIAVKAQVPIMMVALDYANKKVIWAEPFQPSGVLETDVKIIDSFYKNIRGKNRIVTPVLSSTLTQ